MNTATVEALVDFVGDLGNVLGLTLSPYGRSSFCHQDMLFMQQAELDRVTEAVQDRSLRYPQLRVSVGGLPPKPPRTGAEKQARWKARPLCTANRQGFVILPDGRVTPCEELYDHPAFIMGDLKRQSVQEMWSSPRALELLHPARTEIREGPCASCGELDQCNAQPGRCWRDVLKSYGWDKPYFPDPKCPKAPPGARLS
jgi:radical SAM protein with 4Fe4S-binding SPASM domain